MNNRFTVTLAMALVVSGSASAQDWTMQPVSIATRWAASVSPTHAWPDYPRPQMVRPHWQNLNGLWQYAITAKDVRTPQRYEGGILVPYPVESALSGVKRTLQPDQLLWYRRTFALDSASPGERALLHFGAVDYEATIYVNGQRLGTHTGGYQSFTFDLTESLRAGENELVVKVFDPSDQGPNPHGKQSLHEQWAFYSPSSGIWQTVWIEHVPSTYIESLRLTPDVDHSALRMEVAVQGKQDGHVIEAVAGNGTNVVSWRALERATVLPIAEPRLWSPDDPYLYDLEVRLLRNGRVIDAVKSYFGLRKIEVKKDGKGKPRIFLNNRYTYNLGVADQGFWPEGLYTAPSDEALAFDVRAIKALGFNTVRKHIKVEPQRWYFHCDRLGLLVWQDMPSSNNDTQQAHVQFESELGENMAQLHNHPSIVSWVLFNEGWGAYDQERLARRVQQADPSRLLNGHSGPYDQVELAQWRKHWTSPRLLGPLGADTAGLLEEFQDTQYRARWLAGDVADFHYYPGPRMPPAQDGVALVTGEYGSFGAFIEGHVWDETKPVGRGVGASGMSPAQMLETYADSIDQLRKIEAQGLSGSIYFEIFDVEGEHQGFITYDREIVKVPVGQLAQLNATLVPRAKNYAAAIAGFSVRNADQRAESQRLAGLVAEYREGRRDLPFLMRLALMALRQGDQAQATAAGNAFVERAPRPYSKETWAAIAAITHTSSDRGFALLRTHTEEADAMLGPQAARKKLVEIIVHEQLKPHFNQGLSATDWATLERDVGAKYGDLGREAASGAQMMDHLRKENWTEFGKSYARYFETAIPRSLYPLHSLSYRVLQHVTDAKVLATAIRAMRWIVDFDGPFQGLARYDATELDTYANLLYKAGRQAEALEWQQTAMALTGGRDREIADHLESMQRGLPTWLAD